MVRVRVANATMRLDQRTSRRSKDPASSHQALHRAPRLTVRGDHPGCVERRDASALLQAGVPSGACEFDGRLSIAHFRGRYWLYARANLGATGQRHVQVTSSADGRIWSPFELLTLAGYTPSHGDVRCPTRSHTVIQRSQC